MKKKVLNFLLVLLVMLTTSCSGQPTPKPVPSNWGSDLKNQPGYPDFPVPGQHWVIDLGCNFDPETVAWADKTLEQLRLDNISEVAILCVPGVQDLGGSNDGLIWLRNWMRHVRIGSVEADRSIAFLIRPDMDPTKGDRVIAETSGHLFVSVIDYAPIIENAADWANQDQFDGALEEIVRNIDLVLRKRVEVTPIP